MRPILVLGFLTLIFFSCKNDSKQKIFLNDTSSAESLNSKNRDSLIQNRQYKDTANFCRTLIKRAIENSGLNKAILQDFDIWIDAIENKKISIKVTNKNDINADVAIAWVELDLNKNKLNDVTIDPDDPKQLKMDTTLLNLIKNNCTW